MKNAVGDLGSLVADEKRLLEAAGLVGCFLAQAAVKAAVRYVKSDPGDDCLPATLHVGEVAKRWGVSTQTVRNRFAEGLRSFQTPSGRNVVSRDELFRFERETGIMPRGCDD